MINHCSETKCPANNRGSCKITNCLLINPELAVKELESVNQSSTPKCPGCGFPVKKCDCPELTMIEDFQEQG